MRKSKFWALSALALMLAPAAWGAADPGDVKGDDAPTTSSGLNTAVGPDAFGYTAFDETEDPNFSFNYVDISGTGTPAGLAGDDAGTGALPIGFPFDFYGTVYTSAAMSTNGYMNFNTGGDLVDFGNDCPGLNAFDPDQSLYAYWDDLIFDPGSDGFVETFATCPNTAGGFGACTIFQWEGARHLGGVGLFSFQAILYDTNNIVLNFPAGNPEAGDGATIGIENETPSSIGLDYACNTPGSIPASRSVLVCYPGNTCPAVAGGGPPPQEIPTLNTLGLAALLLVLVAAAFLAMRRRRTT